MDEDRLNKIDESLTIITIRKDGLCLDWTLSKIKFNGHGHAVSEKEIVFKSDGLAEELEELYTDLGHNVDVIR